MNEIHVNPGDTLVKDSIPYAIVHMDPYNKKVYLFRKDISYFEGQILSLEDIISNLQDQVWEIIPKPAMDVPNPENKKYRERLDIINPVINAFAPTYMGLIGKKGKPVIKEIMETRKVAKSTVLRYIRMYLQSGCDKGSLYPQYNEETTYDASQKRRGRKAVNKPQSEAVLTPEVKEIFDRYLRKKLKSRETSLFNLHAEMVKREFNRDASYTDENGKLHYRSVPLPESEIPTLRQFKYYYYKMTNYRKRQTAQTSPQEYRNDHRALTGDTVSDAIGPGYLGECDHCSFPLSLISIFSNDTVSRPIVSVMIDDFSKDIAAVGIAFNDNSSLAYTNLMFNLAEDKVELCARYGIPITKEEWPSQYYPRTLRFDSGPDFVSENTLRFCNENGINIDFVPIATGSMKPNVERFFRILKDLIKEKLESHGLITKRHDSRHHEQAQLTIEDFKKIVYNAVIKYHKKYLTNYEPTVDMLNANAEITPIGLWKFGCEYVNAPRAITDFASYNWSLLMIDDSAYISKDGVHFMEEFRYFHEDIRLQMEAAGDKHVPFPIRYDPRDISRIWYIQNGKKKYVELNTNLSYQQDLWGKSILEAEMYCKILKKLRAKGELQNRDIVGTLLVETENVVKEASKRYSLKPGTKDIKGNRAVEKLNAAKSYSPSEALYGLFEEDERKALPDPHKQPYLPDLQPSDTDISALSSTEDDDDDWLSTMQEMNRKYFD